jgi:hypothetical protein
VCVRERERGGLFVFWLFESMYLCVFVGGCVREGGWADLPLWVLLFLFLGGERGVFGVCVRGVAVPPRTDPAKFKQKSPHQLYRLLYVACPRAW